MKRVISYCDVSSCKKINQEAQISFTVIIGWISDPAGGASQADLLPVDLCAKHGSGLIQLLFSKIDPNETLALIKKFMGD